MKVLDDFLCPDGHTTEELVQAGTPHVRCKCGLTADRIISAGHFQLDGSDASYPTAHTRWVREHERAGRNH